MRDKSKDGKRYWYREQVIRHLTADGLVREGKASEASAVLSALSVEVR